MSSRGRECLDVDGGSGLIVASPVSNTSHLSDLGILRGSSGHYDGSLHGVKSVGKILVPDLIAINQEPEVLIIPLDGILMVSSAGITTHIHGLQITIKRIGIGLCQFRRSAMFE